MVLHHRPRSVLWPLSTGFSKDTQCDQPKRFISQCAFPAPDPSPLLFKAIKQTAVDYTLHSKPWAGHLVKGRHSIDKVHDLKELRTWWGNRKSSIHHTHSLNWHLLDIYYITVTNEHAQASKISRTQLSPQSRAEDKSNTQKALCNVVRPKERYVHLKLQKKEVGYHEWHGKVTSTTNNYTSYLKVEGIRCLTKCLPVCHVLSPLVDYTRATHHERAP